MRGFGHAGGFVKLQVPGNNADAVPGEHLKPLDSQAIEAIENTDFIYQQPREKSKGRPKYSDDPFMGNFKSQDPKYKYVPRSNVQISNKHLTIGL